MGWMVKHDAGCFFLLCLVIVCLVGCSIPAYKFGPKKFYFDRDELYQSSNPIHLRVATTILYDRRPLSHRVPAQDQGALVGSANDYTSDDEFEGDVCEKITYALINHLNLAGSFAWPVELASVSASEIEGGSLQALFADSIDAVLTGSIRAFSAYHDKKVWRKIAYSLPLMAAAIAVFPPNTESFSDSATTITLIEIPVIQLAAGALVGLFIDSQHPRREEQHIELDLRLLRVRDGHVLWADTCAIHYVQHRKLFGLPEDKKTELVLSSLFEILNELAASLDTSLSSQE